MFRRLLFGDTEEDIARDRAREFRKQGTRKEYLEGTMNAKAQLTILQPDKRNALLRKQQSEFHREGSLSDRDYTRRRNMHKIYHNADFHICMVETLLGLLLTRDGDLEKYVYELYPLEHKMPNFFFLLSQHLNHPSNQAVTVGLIQKIQKREGPLWNAMQQLLRLVVDGLFFGNAYRATTKIARGAYADVHRSGLPSGLPCACVFIATGFTW